MMKLPSASEIERLIRNFQDCIVELRRKDGVLGGTPGEALKAEVDGKFAP